MKKIKSSILMSVMLICSLAQVQQVIHLYGGVAPTLLLYIPEAGVKNAGTSVIIAPGGGFMSLSINREGVDLA